VSANTAADGSFVLEHVPAGRVTVAVMAGSAGVMESRQMRQVDVREGETVTLEFVSRDILVTGHVTRGGAPAPGIRLRVFGMQGGRMMMSAGGFGPLSAPPAGPQRLAGVTDEGGAFALIVDQPGRHVVNAATADGRVSLPTREVEIPDADSYVLDLAFSGVPVTGVVLDGDTEQPIANASVRAGLREPGPGTGGGGATGADGRFAFEIDPGEYRLSAFAEGYAGETSELTVGAGGAADVRVLLRRGGSVVGRVVDASGRPLGGVWINAVAAPGTTGGGNGQTLPDGSFRIEGLGEGTYTLAAVSELGLFAVRPGVTPGQSGLTLTLRPGVRVQVQVRGPDGAPAEGAFVRVSKYAGTPVWFQGSASTSAQGVTEVLAPAGDVEIEAGKEKLRARAPVSLTSGTAGVVELTLSDPPPPEPAR
jgi:hypothetical protein